jgi:hypothetical protein
MINSQFPILIRAHERPRFRCVPVPSPRMRIENWELRIDRILLSLSLPVLRPIFLDDLPAPGDGQ